MARARLGLALMLGIGLMLRLGLRLGLGLAILGQSIKHSRDIPKSITNKGDIQKVLQFRNNV